MARESKKDREERRKKEDAELKKAVQKKISAKQLRDITEKHAAEDRTLSKDIEKDLNKIASNLTPEEKAYAVNLIENLTVDLKKRQPASKKAQRKEFIFSEEALSRPGGVITSIVTEAQKQKKEKLKGLTQTGVQTAAKKVIDNPQWRSSKEELERSRASRKHIELTLTHLYKELPTKKQIEEKIRKILGPKAKQSDIDDAAKLQITYIKKTHEELAKVRKELLEKKYENPVAAEYLIQGITTNKNPYGLLQDVVRNKKIKPKQVGEYELDIEKGTYGELSPEQKKQFEEGKEQREKFALEEKIKKEEEGRKEAEKKEKRMKIGMSKKEAERERKAAEKIKAAEAKEAAKKERERKAAERAKKTQKIKKSKAEKEKPTKKIAKPKKQPAKRKPRKKPKRSSLADYLDKGVDDNKNPYTLLTEVEKRDELNPRQVGAVYTNLIKGNHGKLSQNQKKQLRKGMKKRREKLALEEKIKKEEEREKKKREKEAKADAKKEETEKRLSKTQRIPGKPKPKAKTAAEILKNIKAKGGKVMYGEEPNLEEIEYDSITKALNYAKEKGKFQFALADLSTAFSGDSLLKYATSTKAPEGTEKEFKDFGISPKTKRKASKEELADRKKKEEEAIKKQILKWYETEKDPDKLREKLEKGMKKGLQDDLKERKRVLTEKQLQEFEEQQKKVNQRYLKIWTVEKIRDVLNKKDKDFREWVGQENLEQAIKIFSKYSKEKFADMYVKNKWKRGDAEQLYDIAKKERKEIEVEEKKGLIGNLMGAIIKEKEKPTIPEPPEYPSPEEIAARVADKDLHILTRIKKPGLLTRAGRGIKRGYHKIESIIEKERERSARATGERPAVAGLKKAYHKVLAPIGGWVLEKGRESISDLLDRAYEGRGEVEKILKKIAGYSTVIILILTAAIIFSISKPSTTAFIIFTDKGTLNYKILIGTFLFILAVYMIRKETKPTDF